MQHSRLSPSSAAQWLECSASVRLQGQFPEEKDSQDSIDGQTAHDLGGRVLCDGDPLHDIVHESNPITDEIKDAVETYVAAVLSITKGAVLQIEQRISIPAVHEKCFGTPDAWWYDTDKGVLHIWDLKFGWGIVEVFRNWQMMLYALGIADVHDFHTIKFHIVQPRAPHLEGPVRTWVLTRAGLFDYLPEIRAAAERVIAGGHECKSGPHCRYCTAMTACTANRHAILNAIDVTYQASAVGLTPERMGFELMILRRANDAISHRLKAVEANALALDRAGTSIPGWARTFTAGSTVWQPGKEDEMRAAAELCGVVVDKPAALKTPIQTVKAGVPKEIVDMYSVKKQGKAKMEPVNFDKLAVVFGGNE